MSFLTDYESANADLAAGVVTNVYVCPMGRVVKMTVILANRAAVDTSVRVSIALKGATDTVAQYIVYDAPIKANQTFFVKETTIQSTDIVRAYCPSGSVSVTVTPDDVRALGGG